MTCSSRGAGSAATLAAASLMVIGLVCESRVAAQQLQLQDLDGQLVDPFEVETTADRSIAKRATVFLFVSSECPVSNRYAPELRRLHSKFQPLGVRFLLVYPNPEDSTSDIRAHLKEYGYEMAAVQDPRQDLVRPSKASVTPEAAVYDRQRRLVYHGRIDDRYVSLSITRPSAVRRDLEEALEALLAGRPVAPAIGPPIGCFIADFVHAH